MRLFNITGSSNLTEHYMLSPEQRLPSLERYIEHALYFVIHGTHQTGKSTLMRALAAQLREAGKAAAWVSLVESQGVTETAQAEPMWLWALQRSTRYLPFPAPDITPFLSLPVGTRLHAYLHAWAANMQQPLILLLDETDGMCGPALMHFLGQLCSGFMHRGIGQFPTSIGLIGMRDLPDYLNESTDNRPASPFHLAENTLTLGNFTETQIGELYAQHTETVFFCTQGQPFLVNALAKHAVKHVSGNTITADHILAAKENLIYSRIMHG
jgi:hypothetical protein